MRCKYSVGDHAQIRKASTDPVHSYSEPVPIDTDVASDTFEQVGDRSSSNSGAVEEMEQPRLENPGQMEQPEYENVMQHRKSCCGGRPGTGSCRPGSQIM